MTKEQIITQLRDRREGLQLTQRGLSDRTGITQSSLSEFESGKTCPTLPTLLRWAAGLGCELTLTRIDGEGATTVARRITEQSRVCEESGPDTGAACVLPLGHETHFDGDSLIWLSSGGAR